MAARPADMARWGPAALLLSEVLVAAMALALGFIWVDRNAPPQHLPWKPLRLDQAPGLFTSAKLNLTEGAGCRAVLEAAGLSATAMPERLEGEFCRTVDAVRLSPTRLSPAAPVMVCRQAAAYAIWERHALQPLALEILGSPLQRVEHFGSYACRRQYGQATGRVSEHASANALDIAAFVLADGRRISVVNDWQDEGPAGRYLRAVRDEACRIFDVALSPDYNAAHRDHLHLDMGPFRACR